MSRPVTLTATGDVVKDIAGSLRGFYVNETSSGTLVLRRGGSGGAAGPTITPAVGWHDHPLDFAGGLHATIGGTLNVTFLLD